MFLAEIRGQPSALRRAADGLMEQAGTLGALATRAGPDSGLQVLFTGMGTSYHACYMPVTLLTGAGRWAGMSDTAELLHFRRPALRSQTLLIIVSQSGRSAEVIGLAEATKDGSRPLIVSVTNGLDNALAGTADIALDTRAGRELAPSTMTFATTLVLLAAVAEVLAGRAPRDATRDVAETALRTAIAAEAMLADLDQIADQLTRWLGACRAPILLGRGTARAAAEAGALLLKEAAGLPAQALESGQFRHGPIELAGPNLAAAIVATEQRTEHLERRIAADLMRAGASVLVIGPPAASPGAVGAISLTDVGRAMSAALAAVPFQMLAWRLAVQRGGAPGSFTVGSKVTTSE